MLRFSAMRRPLPAETVGKQPDSPRRKFARYAAETGEVPCPANHRSLAQTASADHMGEMRTIPDSPADADINGEGVDQIARQYLPMVYATCLRVTGNRQDAEDASQAVFLCLAMQFRRRRRIHSVGPWLYRVARRASVDICRRRKRRAGVEIDCLNAEQIGSAPASTDPASRAELKEIRPVLIDLVNALPLRYRLPLILLHFGGLTHHQLATELKITRKALRVRLHRGHRMLRAHLQQRGVTLAGVALGAVLTELVQAQISDDLLARTVGLSMRVSTYGPCGCGAGVEVLMIAGRLSLGHLFRFRWLVAVAAGLTLVGGGGPLLARIADEWKKLPPLPTMLNWIPSAPRLTAPLPALSDARPDGERPQVASSSLLKHLAVGPAPRTDPSRLAPAPPPLPPRQIDVPRFQLVSLSADRFVTPTISVLSSGGSSLPPTRVSPATQPLLPVAIPGRVARASGSDSAPLPSAHSFDPPAHVSVFASRTLAAADVSPWTNIAASAASITEPLNAIVAPDRLGRWRSIATRPLSFLPQETIASKVVEQTREHLAEVPLAYDLVGRFTLINNGQIVSIGPDDLEDYRSYDAVTSTEENTSGVNGYFARNGGAVCLPPIHIAAGTDVYNWGESPADAQIDMINSLQIVATASTDSLIQIDLLAPVEEIAPGRYLNVASAGELGPELPLSHRFIGLWRMETVGDLVSDLHMTVRYDDLLLGARGLDESAVKLWYFEADHWHRVLGDSLKVDFDRKHISGDVPHDARFFAVSTPEPASLSLLAITAGLLLRRSRRSL